MIQWWWPKNMPPLAGKTGLQCSRKLQILCGFGTRFLIGQLASIRNKSNMFPITKMIWMTDMNFMKFKFMGCICSIKSKCINSHLHPTYSITTYLGLLNSLNHRCAIPARINQYQYLILKNQVSIPISISIFQISEIDTDFNTNTPDLENQYRYQYQYLSFENSITIPIPILKILSFNINLDLNTKVLQYSEWKNFQLPAVNWKCHVAKLIQTKQFGVD